MSIQGISGYNAYSQRVSFGAKPTNKCSLQVALDELIAARAALSQPAPAPSSLKQSEKKALATLDAGKAIGGLETKIKEKYEFMGVTYDTAKAMHSARQAYLAECLKGKKVSRVGSLTHRHKASE